MYDPGRRGHGWWACGRGQVTSSCSDQLSIERTPRSIGARGSGPSSRAWGASRTLSGMTVWKERTVMQEMQTVRAEREEACGGRGRSEHQGGPTLPRGPPRTPSAARQLQEKRRPTPPAHHGRLSMPQEDDHHGQGAEEASAAKQDPTAMVGASSHSRKGQLLGKQGGISCGTTRNLGRAGSQVIHCKSPGQPVS